MIEIATEIASEILGTQRYAVGAVITNKRGRELSRGVNRYDKTHPMQHKWSCRSGKHGKDYLHAEMSAMISNKTNDEHTIYVSRLRADGKWGFAKPCVICHLALVYETKIQRVVYTKSDQTLGEYWIDR